MAFLVLVLLPVVFCSVGFIVVMGVEARRERLAVRELRERRRQHAEAGAAPYAGPVRAGTRHR